MEISVAQAKARFSEILKRAEAGETIVVTRHGKPVARLEGEGIPKKRSIIGAYKGKIRISETFDEPLEEFQDYME